MSKSSKRSTEIVISDKKHGLPYSKGLMASSIMATGLTPSASYRVAKLIEDDLIKKGRFSIRVEDLRELACKTLEEHVGEEYAKKYRKWQALGKLDKPLIILLGGTTGVGKSTIATGIAHRLAIRQVVSTDALREVMRAMLSRELLPALHESSFSAWRVIESPVEGDPLIAGFREQISAISVGVQAVIGRAIREGISIVMEGVHLVPGFIDTQLFDDKAFIIQMIIGVEDEDLHRSHFYVRELQTDGHRPFERYRANFKYIREIGHYVENLGEKHEIPVISSYNLDETISTVLEIVLDEVMSEEKPPARADKKALPK